MSDWEALAQRIDRLESIEAIKQLKHRYFMYCDRKQPERVRQCFCDGEVDIRFGRVGDYNSADALVAVFSELACAPHIVEMHHAQNPCIELTAENQARGTWGLYYYMIDTVQQTTTQLGGFYEDEYRRVDGRWLISATTFTVTSTQLLELNDQRVSALFAGEQAPAEIDDPSQQALDRH